MSKVIEEELKPLVDKKERDVCVKIIDSDQMGKFLDRARSRNQYIIVMVKISSNYALVQPIKTGQTVK